MKRMTSSNYNPCVNCIYSSSCSHIKHNDPVCPERARYDRLAAIEDILGDEYDLDELMELVRAKREGRCVVLPAPLGSQVWQLKYPTRIDKNGEEWVICSIKEATVEPAPFGLTLSMVNQIGKIYWLSKEEAQAALRREQE